MKKFLSFLVAAIVVFGMVSSFFSADGETSLIIDVRTQTEWNNGHLEGAILIPYDVIGKRIEAVAKDKSGRIYVHCRTGRRSQIGRKPSKSSAIEMSGILDRLETRPRR
jgi:phage shock protein E